MTQIIGFCGRARSGKDSSLRVLYGQILKERDVVDRYEVNENGDLLVNAVFEHGEEMGILDISRRDESFVNYAYQMIWPHVKDYHFADNLKIICSKLYGITYEQMFGTTEQKNSETEYVWKEFMKSIPTKYRPKQFEVGEKVTARQFMQYFADILRDVNDNCFVNAALQEIEQEQCPVALVGDVRRVSEVEAIKKLGGKVIYLKRTIDPTKHRTETEFDGVDESLFDYVVDNQEMDMKTKNFEILRIGREIGVIN